MGPIIILDKSTFQSLSFNDILFLNKYYTLNIVPILIIEIMGDLKKEFKNGSKPANKVKEYADKLLQSYNVVNVHYKDLIISNLLNFHLPMDGRPVISNLGKVAKDEKGGKGIVCDVSLEEKVIDRWRLGRFKESEELLATRWRETIKSIDIDRLKDKYKIISDNLGCFHDIVDLNNSLDKLLHVPGYQKTLLVLLIYEFSIRPALASKILFRWEEEKHNNLQRFSPYAFYCFKTVLLFYIGLRNNLIKNDPKNKIDLEYFYYLPFSMVFSSDDKFHKQMVEVLLRDDQMFIEGIKLKQDLSNIFLKWNNLSKDAKVEWNKEYRNYPPENNGSPTLLCWEKFMKKREDIKKGIHLSPQQEEEIIKHINKIVDSTGDDITTVKRLDEAAENFMVRKRTIRGIDPCPCKSGKRFYECCLEKIENKRRKSNKE